MLKETDLISGETIAIDSFKIRAQSQKQLQPKEDLPPFGVY